MKFKKRDEPVFTTDPYYDLFEGGYVVPEELLEDPEDAKRVRAAMKVLEDFWSHATDSGAVEVG